MYTYMKGINLGIVARSLMLFKLVEFIFAHHIKEQHERLLTDQTCTRQGG